MEPNNDAQHPPAPPAQPHGAAGTRPLRLLDQVAVGWPVSREGLSFFPLYLAANELPAMLTGADSGLDIGELDMPEVRALKARNPRDKPVLLVEGEHFVGGDQNRSVNVTVLVSAGSELEIPVSCLERGRWGARRAARRDAAYSAHRVRARQSAGVAESLRRSGSRRGDQGAVWTEVDALLARHDAPSPTAAAADVHAIAARRGPRRAHSAEELARRGPLPGQCGLVVTHGRWVMAMDLFGAPHMLAAHWAGLVRSHLLEPPVATGAPSATRVLALVRRFASAPATSAPAVGLGTEHRVRDNRIEGHALTLDGALVHAAFFAQPPQDAAM